MERGSCMGLMKLAFLYNFALLYMPISLSFYVLWTLRSVCLLQETSEAPSLIPASFFSLEFLLLLRSRWRYAHHILAWIISFLSAVVEIFVSGLYTYYIHLASLYFVVDCWAKIKLFVLCLQMYFSELLLRLLQVI